MRTTHFAGIFFFVAELLFGGIFLFYSCFHYHDFWSLLIFLPVALAFFTPAICYGYSRESDDFANTAHLEAETFRSCRELGWALAAVLLMGAYGIPVLAWYNASLGWLGVIGVHAALNCWMWAYIIWLRIFVFY